MSLPGACLLWAFPCHREEREGARRSREEEWKSGASRLCDETPETVLHQKANAALGSRADRRSPSFFATPWRSFVLFAVRLSLPVSLPGACLLWAFPCHREEREGARRSREEEWKSGASRLCDETPETVLHQKANAALGSRADRRSPSFFATPWRSFVLFAVRLSWNRRYSVSVTSITPGSGAPVRSKPSSVHMFSMRMFSAKTSPKICATPVLLA